MKTINFWDVKEYMPCDNYIHVKKKRNQIVPDELISTPNPYSCSICLEGSNKTHVCVGFCGHVIHKKCFFEGSLRNNTPHMLCPICRCDFFVRKVYKCT